MNPHEPKIVSLLARAVESGKFPKVQPRMSEKSGISKSPNRIVQRNKRKSETKSERQRQRPPVSESCAQVAQQGETQAIWSF